MRLREASVYVWLEEPICTVFSFTDRSAREDNCLSILDTVIEHHPRLAKLHFVGVHDSEILRSRLNEYNFVPFEPHKARVVFVRRIDLISNVHRLQLDATSWNNVDDVYKSLFAVLGSPEWHGKNFNALHDSIVTGCINTVEVPYTLSIRNMKSANGEVRRFVSDLADLISESEARGCPVSIEFEDDPQ
jgi:RNAse (barnase) inhibitor barstar